MRTLQTVRPTPEQLAILGDTTPGPLIIRGAAGSGKTTTAILRLRALVGFFLNRRRRDPNAEPVRALVLTFNRTLRGYISELVHEQVAAADQIDLEVSTFGAWARARLGRPIMLEHSERAEAIKRFGRGITLDPDFLVGEVEYALGRFPADRIGDYRTEVRIGRGATPQVRQPLRRQILDQVIGPYTGWKEEEDKTDWNDLAPQSMPTIWEIR